MTSVLDLRTREEGDLARLLSSMQEQAKTGTLKLRGADGRVKYVYLKRGTVELLKTNRSRTLLGKALLKRHKLTDEQLRAALERQKAATGSLRLGEILVGMGIVKESDVHQALAYQIAEEIFELFTWEHIESEFYRGEPPLDIFESEDLQARVSLSPVQLAREAIRRQNELAEIRRTLPSPGDVLAPLQRAYRPDNEQNPAIAEVLSCLDGQRTIGELLDVVRAPDLVALRVLVKMVQEGDAVPLSASELIPLGQALEERGELERAQQRYRRAEDLGHPDFDLPRRIGQIAEALGDVAEACRRYAVYADRCDQAGYPEVAAQTLERVLQLDPDQAHARQRYGDLLVKQAKAAREAGDASAGEVLEKAAAQYERLLERAASPEQQRAYLSELVEILPGRDDLRERLAQVSISLGDSAQAVIELQELATNALEAQRWERAVEVLEKILSIDPNDIMAVQSLASTYAQLGRTDDAVRQYLSFATSLEESGLAAASGDTLVDIYEKIVELDPTNTHASRFLATAYEGKKNADKALAHYSRVVESLRESGDDEQLAEALDRLSELKPHDPDVALERARLKGRLGDPGESARIYRSVAESAHLKGDDGTAAEAWRELLAVQPGDLEAHLAVARLQASGSDEHEAAARRCAAVFELALLAENEELAYEAVKLALDIDPDDPTHRRRLADIQARRGRAEEAARTLVRAARRARDDEDLGRSRSWARRALELDATCDDARELLENLRRQAAAASAPAPAPEQRGPTINATITGGGRSPGIEGFAAKTRRVGNIADRLRSMKGLGGSPQDSSPQAPEPGSSETRVISRKASNAMNKLRALKRGETPAEPSSDQLGALPDDASGGRKVSKGPEAPGSAADAKVSKKASSALNKLKALRAGGGEPAPASADPAASSGQKVSKGPEAPGAAADAKVSKKASSALNKLKALRAGGGEPAPASAGPAASSGQKVSKGPEAPGEAADTKVSKKASSALNKLKALRAGGGEPAASPGPAAASGQQVSKGPEAPGAAADAQVSKKATSALSKLKALRAGGGSPTASPGPGATSEQKVSKGPEAPGEAADAQVSKKATSALSKLKALRAGGGSGGGATSAPAAAAQKVSKGPEAPGEAADAQVSKKASSAMDRLRALKAQKGSGGAGAPGA